MYLNYKVKKIDPKNPYKPAFYGTFEIEVSVENKKRRMIAYVPDEIRESTAGILVLGENGKTADDMLRESGWCKLADQEECKEKFIVFFLEPENGSWNINEEYGMLNGDVAYINAAALKAAERWLFCVHESKVYLTGCKEGGVLANMAAMWNPAFYAGIATVGGSSVNTEYMEAARNDYCTYLDGYEDVSHRKDIKKGEIPMPAWIIDDPGASVGRDTGVLKYWMNACSVDEKPRQTAPDQVEYFRTRELEYYPNEEKEAFRVCFSSIDGSSENFAYKLQRRIWKDFLYRQRRWMSGPGGDLRVTCDPVKDLKMDYHYEEVDGWMREWYVYIPEKVKNNPNTKVPLILAMHGYTCTGEIYIGNSGWNEVADKYGLIVIFPSALHGNIYLDIEGADPNWAPLNAWNIFQENDRPDELKFFDYMINSTVKKYPIDENRIFATGHSWGSLMTQMLGLAMPERFAAIAPCSGIFFGNSLERMLKLPYVKEKLPQLPVWMQWGMEEPWLIPPKPEHDNSTGKSIEFWARRNGKEDMIPKDWSDYPCTVNGRFLDHYMEKEGTAPVWFTQVDYMPHATMPEMSFRIWEEFFSRF